MLQLGTLGAGNHYAEMQVVEEIFDKAAAQKMGIHRVGQASAAALLRCCNPPPPRQGDMCPPLQVCIMIHSGSRGLGHQVATDALTAMETAMARDGIATNDRQLACARIASQEGQDYLVAMACAANFAWVNRSAMTFLVRQAFAKQFGKSPDELDMHIVYDVSHNIAKVRPAGQVAHCGAPAAASFQQSPQHIPVKRRTCARTHPAVPRRRSTW